MIRIKSVAVNGIGPFSKLNIQFGAKKRIDLADIHILTGDNGCGKTTLLNILISEIGGLKYLKDRVNNEFEKNSYSVIFEESEWNLTQEFSWEHKKYSNEPINWVGNPRPVDSYFEPRFRLISDKFEAKYNRPDFGVFCYSGNRELTGKPLVTIEEVVFNPFKNALDFDNSIDSDLIVGWIASIKTKILLAASKNENSKAESYAKTLDKFYEAVEEITGNRFEFDLADNPLGVVAKLNGSAVSLSVLSNGIKSIITWLLDLFMRMEKISWKNDLDISKRNFLLFLDEIDVHLHPAWQRKILPVIQKLFKNAQIFISTHSPFVVGSVDGAWIYKFKKEGQFSVLDGDPILSEDSKSFQYILEETFDISQQFGIEIEKKFNQFYHLKAKVLKREVQFEDIDFQKIIGDLSNESIEVQNIIGMELKQIKRNLGIKEEVV